VIFIAIVVILGLVTRQPRRYWAYAGAAVGVQLLTGFLFAGGGTLEDPTGDGLITASIRRATNDGPQMGILGLGVIALAWGVPIWLVARGYQRKRSPASTPAPEAGNPPRPQNTQGHDPN
jgi:hypothetical protein